MFAFRRIVVLNNVVVVNVNSTTDSGKTKVVVDANLVNSSASSLSEISMG